MRATGLVFELEALKAETKDVLTDYSVAMLTSYVTKKVITRSLVIGHLLVTIIVAPTENERQH